MSNNREKIYLQYGDGAKEEARAFRSRSSSLEFHYTKCFLEPYITKESRVFESGCATGYYGLYFASRCREYVGMDLCPAHIELFNKKITESGSTNISCSVGDATQLEGVADESFDVVLCLGPMYHLPPAERGLALAECRRVCKPGGIVAFAYINKLGGYAGACICDPMTYPTALANERVLLGGVDDMRPDTFFYTTPEEMNAMAEAEGLEKIANLGTDFFFMESVVNRMTDERFELARPLYDQMAMHESCTGLSNHALLICRKR